MKKYISAIFCLLFTPFTFAQVGINTDNPVDGSIVHIDPQGNTSPDGLSGTADDVIVTTDGKVGIGTLSPEADLDIKDGKIRITDIKEKEGKVLRSENNKGAATWRTLSFANKMVECEISVTVPSVSATPLPINGHIVIGNNELGAKIIRGSVLSIPSESKKWGYMVFINGGAEGVREFGKLSVKVPTATTPLVNIVYGDNLSGRMIFLYSRGYVMNNLEINLVFEPLDVRSDPNKQISFYDPLPYSKSEGVTFKYKLQVLRLQY